MVHKRGEGPRATAVLRLLICQSFANESLSLVEDEGQTSKSQQQTTHRHGECAVYRLELTAPCGEADDERKKKTANEVIESFELFVSEDGGARKSRSINKLSTILVFVTTVIMACAILLTLYHNNNFEAELSLY